MPKKFLVQESTNILQFKVYGIKDTMQNQVEV